MHKNSCQLSAFSHQLETELRQSEFLLPPELGWNRRKLLTTVRRRKAEVVRLKSETTNMKVSHPNLFSYEASFLRIFESLPSALAKWFGLARKANDQQPMTNDSNFVGDHTAGVHPFPSRTRKLSPAGPIVLHAKVCGRVGHRRHKIKGHREKSRWPFPFGIRCTILHKWI